MGSYATYRRPLWPWQWVRWWLLRWRSRRPESDGRDYTGWSARLNDEDVRPAGSVGEVVESHVQCGQLVHTIDFDGWLVTTPLPWQGVDLLPPVRAGG